MPVVIADNLTDKQVKMYRIADNRTGEETEFDYDLLKIELQEIENVDLEEIADMTAFDIDEIKAMLDEEPEDTEGDDEAGEVQDEAISMLGEIYELGEHRLMCGDSTSEEDVQALMGGEKADMVFTDPPYGISIVSAKTGQVGAGNFAKNGVYSEVIGDETTDTAENCYKTCVDLGYDKFIIWGGNYFTKFLPFSNGWIIWDKRGAMNSNNFADGEMAWCSFHTPIRIFKQIWNGMIREGESEKRVHPTQKPINMLGDVLDRFTEPKENILDLFGGSGSTLLACAKTNRKCRMMELDPKYCDVIRRRWTRWAKENGKELGSGALEEVEK